MATDYLLIKGIGVKPFMNNRDVVFKAIVNLLTADQQRKMWLDYDLRKQDNVDENNLLVGMAI